MTCVATLSKHNMQLPNVRILGVVHRFISKSVSINLAPISVNFTSTRFLLSVRCFFVRRETDTTLLPFAYEVLCKSRHNERDWVQRGEHDSNNLSTAYLKRVIWDKEDRGQTCMGIGCGCFSQMETHTQVAPRHHTQS